LKAFQTEPYGSNVTVFNIIFRENGMRSTEYDFNINTIIMKNLTYSLFIINLEINIFTHYLLNIPLYQPFYLSVYNTEELS
jgi:hypothetical protein